MANKPVFTRRLNRVEAAVWQNETEGTIWHNVTFQRTYRDEQGVTKRLFESGLLLGIKLLDHVIATDRQHYSFSDNGDL